MEPTKATNQNTFNKKKKEKGLIYRGFWRDEVCYGDAIPRLGLATSASKLRSPPRDKAS